MATSKSAQPAPAVNADVQAFLTDPKHQQQRDFMTALIDARLAEKTVAAEETTRSKGGNFIDNFFAGITGDLFSGDDK